MKERPILFNAEMVKAILSGRKTQTRRVVKFPLRDVNMGCELAGNELAGEVKAGDYRNCPLGQPGDQLWVRETFATLGNEDGCAIDWQENLVKTGGPDAARVYRASCEQRPGNYGLWSIPDDAFWKPHTENMQYEGSWVPSIHMPRWASRIQLEIINVGVQRLQDISSGDAVREGICQLPASGRYCINPGDQYFGGASRSAKEVYSWLWESIYGEGSWQANPWVWVIEFERVAPAGDQS
ncbi:ASCH domain-containing protein [Rahnella victoriana]|uniref:hypothetical protein n=1 Tax=Rahnella victoriana TaxID=1510570 RepID=UPI001E605B92|nr:hypothetical protein [Rahnella victoriana]UHM89822.1 hypothetical protein J9880_16145 [Rahnella victoriana]